LVAHLLVLDQRRDIGVLRVSHALARRITRLKWSLIHQIISTSLHKIISHDEPSRKMKIGRDEQERSTQVP
jgi:hypothetical protein